MENIFNMAQDAEQTDKKSNEGRDAVQKAASFFHKAPDGDEPDWQGMLLNAKDSTEKYKIRAAREAFQAEKKWKQHQQAAQQQQARTAEVLRTPTRNKAFYDSLRTSEPVIYWSTEVQRQMRADRASMGLGFLLKNGGK